MQAIREKIKRKLSMHDKNPDLDDIDDAEDVDEETTGHLTREIDKAEENDWATGKPGSFLNKLIMHGNKKTEDQIAAEAAERQAREQGATTATTTTATTQ